MIERTKTKWIKKFLLIALVVFFISNIVAIQSKALLMRENGKKATGLIDKILPFVAKIPLDGTLLLLNPPSNEIEYSVFLIRGFSVLEYGLHRIKQLSQRNDIKITIIERPELRKIETERHRIIHIEFTYMIQQYYRKRSYYC